MTVEDQHATEPDGIGERLAAALVQRDEDEPDAFYCGCCDTLEVVAHWLRKNAAAVLSAAPGAVHYDEVTEYRVIGEWGTTKVPDEETAREQVRRARAFAPPIQARAEWRSVRTWPDGGRHTGPWQALVDDAVRDAA